MNSEITLYPRNASKDDLRNYLENRGFIRCRLFWDQPGGALHYSWLDYEDSGSVEGVSVRISPREGDREKSTGNCWALHVRYAESTGLHNVKKLQQVLQGARTLFGGTIKGDHESGGLHLPGKAGRTAMSNDISGIYSRVTAEIDALRLALSEPSSRQSCRPGRENRDNGTGAGYPASEDPYGLIFDALVPYAASRFEFFFSRTFRVLLRHDEFALDKRRSCRRKIRFTTLLEVESKSRSIEDVIAEKYTFRNLNQLNTAYTEWLNIDVRSLLFKEESVGHSSSYLEKCIAEILEHHRDGSLPCPDAPSLTREGYLHMLGVIEKALLEFVRFLEFKYTITITAD